MVEEKLERRKRNYMIGRKSILLEPENENKINKQT